MTADMRGSALVALALGTLLTGCATAYSRGQEALREGRYEAAAHEFEAAAASSGKPLDALTALGIAWYKLGDFARARDTLRGVLAEDPKRGEARFYVALAELGQHEDAQALEDLEALRPLIGHPRIAAAVDRAMVAIREGLSEPARRLLAAGLDDTLEWAREVRDARRHAYSFDPWPIYRGLYHPHLR
ncbi:MAG TPA: tetratricopeptide repeat protein [Solirubrobacterales bacterium]|nr:tetratricopeptide repeat protein [Solirubrobacterales bacterium]